MSLRQRPLRWAFFLVMTAVSISAAELETREVRLSTLSDQAEGWVVVSPDCKGVASLNRDDSGFWVMSNGVPLKKYATVAAKRPVFSPDSKRLAYVVGAPEGVKSIVVVDGKEWPPVERMAQTNGLRFSPDSKRLAVVCGEGELFFLIVDGTNGPSYQVLGAPKFSPDGQRLAYGASPRAGKYMLVVDGKAGAEYDSISDPVFSPDSKHVACVCMRDGKKMVVVDRQEQRAYPEICSFPHLVTPVTRGESSIESGAAPWFSPDGKRLAYFAGKPGKWRIVEEKLEGDNWRLVDQKSEGDEWENVGLPRFSPDSSHLAFCAGRGERQFVVFDGTTREFEGKLVSVGAAFSPDSKRFAHILVRDNERMCVVVNGVAEADYEHIATDADGRNLFFSPDSKHLAYIAERNYKWRVVRDGVEDKAYYQIATVRFSPDSKHLGYRADVSARSALVIDGTEADIKPGDRIWSDWVWDNASTACVAVVRGRDILRVEVTVR
jgi:WD40 repeat protein